MKIIGLMPAKNESWILPYTLKPLSQICDHIIVADQNSTDKSNEVYKNFSKVTVIKNNVIGHSNTVRWNLLDTARNFDGKNLIISIDADEIIIPKLLKDYLYKNIDSISSGTLLSFQWIQLWKSLNYYRNDDFWGNNWKPIGFLDDRKIDYNRSNIIINDHTSRTPGKENTPITKMHNVPLIHLQWVFWNRAQIKQAWYRCTELIENNSRAWTINKKYKTSLDNTNAKLKATPKEWILDINIPTNLNQQWQFKEILQWFDQYGIKYFEPLQIWHIQELHNEFVKKMGRQPKAILKPPLHIRAKTQISKFIPSKIKNKIKNKYHLSN
jgi:hypothetical protein